MNIEELKKIVDEVCDYKNNDPFYDKYYDPYYRLMTVLGEMTEGILVELGIHNGRGIHSFVLSGNPVIGIDHTKHPNIDLVQEMHPNFMFLKRDSNPPPGEITSQGKCISVLHIDTEHSYSMAETEFNVYKPFLMDNSFVLFDDLYAKENDVKRFFDSLDYPKISDDRLHSCGYGVLLYEHK